MPDRRLSSLPELRLAFYGIVSSYYRKMRLSSDVDVFPTIPVRGPSSSDSSTGRRLRLRRRRRRCRPDAWRGWRWGKLRRRRGPAGTWVTPAAAAASGETAPPTKLTRRLPGLRPGGERDRAVRQISWPIRCTCAIYFLFKLNFNVKQSMAKALRTGRQTDNFTKRQRRVEKSLFAITYSILTNFFPSKLAIECRSLGNCHQFDVFRGILASS